ncbi:hypothetical protein [Cohnella abietis]|uniref:DUF4129 domain-containing protein n=1 Tax=Cohnella abietis TaxID=2507935 RepID=A0A3T1CZ73_9BACL|nr:hypothetical protein [Cohnella abietis]BBI31055.1 hypothetical protein KCTCHS21_04540 [Cohnella abietis]
MAKTPYMGKIANRLLLELFIWLPIWLILTDSEGSTIKLVAFIAAIAAFGLGFALFNLPVAWSRFTLVMILILLVLVGSVKYTSELPLFIWMGVLLWRGRYPRATVRHHALGFLICTAAVIVASNNENLHQYRWGFIVLAIIWMVTWFVAFNRGLLEEAGLGNSIVTRPVRLTSRRYLFIFLTASLLIFALTVSYGQQLLTPPKINTDWMQSGKQEPPMEPPVQQQDPLSKLKNEDQGPPSLFWKISEWIMVGVAVIVGLWFVKLLWKDREWTWRSMIKAIREWFLREKKAEKLPYVEERRSLIKEKKKGAGLWDTLFHRQKHGRAWELLNNPEKVRRVYEEAVLTSIEQGYDFKSYHSPSETIEGIQQWRLGQQLLDKKDKNSAYWKRLLHIRKSLLMLYEKARYSPHEITEKEVEGLKEQDPQKKS